MMRVRARSEQRPCRARACMLAGSGGKRGGGWGSSLRGGLPGGAMQAQHVGGCWRGAVCVACVCPTDPSRMEE